MKAEILKSLFVLLTIIFMISCKEQPKPNEATATAQVQDPIENSRAFNHNLPGNGGDVLMSVVDSAGTQFCKATFVRASIEDLLSDSPDNYWVKIYSHYEGTPGKRNFKMRLYDSANIQKDVSDWAEYPCPKECFPIIQPKTLSLLEDTYNTFDIADIRKVLSFTNCTFINVHHSSWTEGGKKFESLSIYPLTGADIDSTVSHHDEPDYSFTSVLEIP